MDGAAGDVVIQHTLKLLSDLSIPKALGWITGNPEAVSSATPTLAAALETGVTAAVPVAAAAASSAGGTSLGSALSIAGIVAGAAATAFKVAPRLRATKGDVNIKKGQEHMRMKEYEEAIECFDAAIEQDPGHRSAYNNRAVAYYYLGLYESCIADCDNQLLYNREEPIEPLMNKALAYEELGRLDEALIVWDDAVSLAEGRAELWHHRGQLQARLQLYPQAINDFSRAIELDPNFALAFVSRADAEIHLPEGNFSKALEDLDRALDINPELSEAHNILGKAYVRRAKETWGSNEQRAANLNLALTKFQKALDINPHSADTYFNRGYVHKLLGNRDEALEDYGRALEYNEKMLMAYVQRASLYTMPPANHIAALQECNEALRRDSGFWPALNQRATIYLDQGRFKEAVADYNSALRKLEAEGKAGTSSHAVALENLEAAKSAMRKADGGRD